MSIWSTYFALDDDVDLGKPYVDEDARGGYLELARSSSSTLLRVAVIDGESTVSNDWGAEVQLDLAQAKALRDALDVWIHAR